MPIKYSTIKTNAIKTVAEHMVTAARTAPKTKGQDNLVIAILDKKDISKIRSKMKQISKRDNRPGCMRDADNIKNTEYIVVIATKKAILGLNCGFCGYTSCLELSKTKGMCVYNAMDLGIALGSASGISSTFHIDSRLMYSIGKAVLESGIIGKNLTQAIGIPLSATGKNPFFDRK